MNDKTTVGTILTVIGLIPAGLHLLTDLDIPTILVKVGAVCAFLTFIYTGVQTQSKKD